MKRVAWFTPLPSTSPGIPCHRLTLISRLQEKYTIDLFIGTIPKPPQDNQLSVFSAYDFVWKHLREPYDLAIYDLADSQEYSFVWPYLVRYPGLVVLHDERLHRSRAWMLQRQGPHNAYHEEFHYNHPQAKLDIPDLGVSGLLGSAAELWPMRRVVTESSRLLVAPNAWIAAKLRSESSHDRVEVIESGAPPVASAPDAREEIRNRYGVGSDAVLFAMFGPATRERRIDRVLSTLALLKHQTPPLHLLICGEVDNVYEHEADRLDIADRVSYSDVDASNLSAHLAAADVCLCLQWPSRHDAVASWVESLAAGKPTIIMDMADWVDIPTLDPRGWQARPVAREHPAITEALQMSACVSIQIIDEDHSLQLAMARLAGDPRLRKRIGLGAKRLWEHRFQFNRVVRDYEEVIRRAIDIPLSVVHQPNFPEHLHADGTEQVKSLLKSLGVHPEGLERLAPTEGPEVPSDP